LTGSVYRISQSLRFEAVGVEAGGGGEVEVGEEEAFAAVGLPGEDGAVGVDDCRGGVGEGDAGHGGDRIARGWRRIGWRAAVLMISSMVPI
jgi:hypothetical protein